jgi:hypothetical protein
MWKQVAKVLPKLQTATNKYGRRSCPDHGEYISEIKTHLICILNQYKRTVPPNNRCSRCVKDYLQCITQSDSYPKTKEQLHNFTITTLRQVKNF